MIEDLEKKQNEIRNIIKDFVCDELLSKTWNKDGLNVIIILYKNIFL